MFVDNYGAQIVWSKELRASKLARVTACLEEMDDH